MTETLAAHAIPRDTRIALYELQYRLRVFEKRAYDLFLQNLVKGTSHLALGQEAVAAGFATAMRRDDWTFCTYRGHDHTIARGVSMAGCMAELLGRANGVLAGKGGSMHLGEAAKYAMGSYAIIGAQMCIAVGAGWTSQYKKTQQVSVCFFGDGTTNIGAFHEALNLAAVWKLPVVFVCENNMYMEYTAIDTVTSVKRPAADRASAYGLEPIVIDGNDADACFLAAETAYERARRGDGPSLIEALTYRHGGHSRADPAKYRPDAEVAEWLERDPVPVYRARLLAAGVGEQTLAAIEAAAMAEIDAATEGAKNGPVPSADAIEADTWADGTSTWRN
jgi:acetoin:2,6-dichlorophenolindophenol oxidoreductase subunit alpha